MILIRMMVTADSGDKVASNVFCFAVNMATDAVKEQFEIYLVNFHPNALDLKDTKTASSFELVYVARRARASDGLSALSWLQKRFSDTARGLQMDSITAIDLNNFPRTL